MRPTLLLLAFLPFSLHAQVLQWVNAFGGSPFARGEDVLIALNGDVLTIGSFEGTVDMDPGPDVFELTASTGALASFVCRLNSEGDFLSAFMIDRTWISAGAVLDADGNVILSGGFDFPTDLDPGPGLFPVAPVGSRDVFVVKIDPQGQLLWAKYFGGDDIDESFGIALGANGRIHIMGDFWHTVDFDPGIGIEERTSLGAQDAFVLALNAEDGAFIWCSTFGSTTGDHAVGMALNAQSNIHITGSYGGSTTNDFDPGPGIVVLPNSNVQGFFLSKLASDGSLVWAHGTMGTAAISGSKIACAPNGQLVITGKIAGTADIDPTPGVLQLTSTLGDLSMFMANYSSEGIPIWAHVSGPNSQFHALELAVDQEGYIHTAGLFMGTLDLEPASGEHLLGGEENMTSGFIARSTSDGEYLWSWALPSSRVCGIAMDDDDHLYATGSFHASLDFDPSSAVHELTPVNAQDAFVLKLGKGGVGIPPTASAMNGPVLFPSPASDQVSWSWPERSNKLSITVFDAVGRTVLVRNGMPFKGSMDVSAMTPGRYTVVLQDRNERKALPLVIMH